MVSPELPRSLVWMTPLDLDGANAVDRLVTGWLIR
jgi:hypothetical protein